MKRKNIEKCRSLRKNQTEAEKKLWTILRNRQINGTKFRRQFPVESYIIDFYCPELKFGIEVDGGEHYKEENIKRDEIRTRQLSKLGIEIIRISNNEILSNIHGVGQILQEKMDERKNSPHLHPLPGGERRKC